MPKHERLSGDRGFTLIELMVTLAVLGILAAVTIPSYNDLTVRNRVNSTTNEITSLLRYARSEALTARSDVSICGINPADASACLNNFSNGIRVSRGTTELQTVADIPATLAITMNVGNLSFSSDGTANSAGITLTDNTESICMLINGSGQTRTQSGVCPP